MKRLLNLEGRWRVLRDIDDRLAGLTGQFEGEALWSLDTDGLVQTETGVMTYGTAPPMQATRRYLWREDAGGLHVFFDDGRPFHTVPPPGKEALHDCPPDTYRVRYSFAADTFTTIWHVTGPRKDAVLSSVFTRVNGVKP